MKLNKILLGLVISAGLTACTEDYTNWSSPQSNDQGTVEDAAVLTLQPTKSSWNLADVSEDSIQIFTSNQQAINGYYVTILGGTSTTTLNATNDGKVAVNDLNDAIFSLYPQEAVERSLALHAKAKFAVTTDDGTVITEDQSSSISIKVTPVVLVRPAAADAAEDPHIMYMTGANYGWGSTWVPLHQVNGNDNVAWVLVYLHADEEFKFSPVAAWSGDFSPTVANDYAESGITTPNNCKAAKDGWFILKVDKSTKTMDVYPPKVYLIGDCAGGWSCDDANLFSVPETADGKFVSNAFAKDAQIRMCVSIGEDWWKTEFVGLNYNGTYWITYRANGGDQERVNVLAGQKAYITFGNGYCQYK